MHCLRMADDLVHVQSVPNRKVRDGRIVLVTDYFKISFYSWVPFFVAYPVPISVENLTLLFYLPVSSLDFKILS